MTNKNEKTDETSAVTHIAWKAVKRNGNTYWTRVGVAYKPHKDGKGFTATITEGIAVMGDIVFREPKPEAEEAPEQPAPAADDITF